jgi:hypothetical protein
VALVAADRGSSLRWRAVFTVVLPVCAEAHAFSSSSLRVFQQGEEDGERLTVALFQAVKRERDRRD